MPHRASSNHCHFFLYIYRYIFIYVSLYKSHVSAFICRVEIEFFWLLDICISRIRQVFSLCQPLFNPRIAIRIKKTHTHTPNERTPNSLGKNDPPSRCRTIRKFRQITITHPLSGDLFHACTHTQRSTHTDALRIRFHCIPFECVYYFFYCICHAFVCLIAYMRKVTQMMPPQNVIQRHQVARRGGNQQQQPIKRRPATAFVGRAPSRNPRLFESMPPPNPRRHPKTTASAPINASRACRHPYEPHIERVRSTSTNRLA